MFFLAALAIAPLVWVSHYIGPQGSPGRQTQEAHALAEAMMVQQQAVLTAVRASEIGAGAVSTANIQTLMPAPWSPPYPSDVQTVVGTTAAASTVVVTWYKGARVSTGALITAMADVAGYIGLDQGYLTYPPTVGTLSADGNTFNSTGQSALTFSASLQTGGMRAAFAEIK
ncbi:hypothetical protein CWS72_26970 [Telmatospirillum siberiense]|uniref:Uncharacterized protein n=1 Tax=Telmatospirillum siberiense TaxID=382514 RepID=A0A2N3PLW8_9PROT|nr:hypothetical protein CWS72_26970 [Telmatospirillum siberiense]